MGKITSRLMLTLKASMSSQQPAPNNVICCSFPSITRPKRNHVKETATTLRQWLLLTLPHAQTCTQCDVTCGMFRLISIFRKQQT